MGPPVAGVHSSRHYIPDGRGGHLRRQLSLHGQTRVAGSSGGGNGFRVAVLMAITAVSGAKGWSGDIRVSVGVSERQ